MSDLLELAARFEAAERLERRLFLHAFAVCFPGRHMEGRSGFASQEWDSFKQFIDAKAWLEAAIILVPGGHHWQVGIGIETEFGNRDKSYAWCSQADEGDLSIAAAPALALCAAALKARAAQ